MRLHLEKGRSRRFSPETRFLLSLPQRAKSGQAAADSAFQRQGEWDFHSRFRPECLDCFQLNEIVMDNVLKKIFLELAANKLNLFREDREEATTAEEKRITAEASRIRCSFRNHLFPAEKKSMRLLRTSIIRTSSACQNLP